MSLPAGSRIGPYEVVAPLGAGGMGEVFRARDTRLGREVAIKVLPAAFATDSERVARFRREAQLLASLNDPRIAAIHGLEDAGGVLALALELVEGEELGERLKRGPLPVDEALAIARQLAEGLEAAHEKGIVHRDLKPANVKVRSDGQVKILDFGLAKVWDDNGAASADLSQSPTVTPGTQAGIVLGTAAYMAPEQARGRPVDKRADIWAFGAVLYEMLTGRRLFEGETVSDTLAAVLTREPDWSRLPQATPASVRQLLRRCLERDPKARLRDIGEARLLLSDPRGAAALPAAPGVPERAPVDSLPPRRSRLSIALPILTLAIGAAAGVWWQRTRTGVPRWIATQLGGPRIALQPRVSPDGRMLAFLTLVGHQSQVGIMSTTTGDWSLLTREPTNGLVASVSWSRDGTRVYFDRIRANGREIYSISPLGGEPRLVLENGAMPEPLPDGSLLFLRHDALGRWQLHRHWLETSKVAALPVLVHASFAGSALRAFPDGREAVAFGRLLSDGEAGLFQLVVVDLETAATRVLPHGAELARTLAGSDTVVSLAVSTDGREVLTTAGVGSSSTVLAIPRDGSAERRFLFTTTRLVSAIDEAGPGRIYIDQVDRSMDHLRFPVPGGQPELLTTGLPVASEAGALVLPDGRGVYATVIAGRRRLAIGRAGQELVPFVETQEEARGPLAHVNDHEFMFVGGTLERPIVVVASSATGRIVRRLEETRGRRLTRLAASADGRTLYFAEGGEIWTMPLAGGQPRVLTRGTAITPGPQGAVFVGRPEVGDVAVVRVDGAGAETRLSWPAGLQPTGLSLWPRALSPDGRLLVVTQSDESWFWGPAVYDLNSNRVTRVPLDYAGDAEVDLAWDGDRITALARRLEGAIWRFESVR